MIDNSKTKNRLKVFMELSSRNILIWLNYHVEYTFSTLTLRFVITVEFFNNFILFFQKITTI